MTTKLDATRNIIAIRVSAHEGNEVIPMMFESSVSTLYWSLENLFRILPIGVLSKKDMGECMTEVEQFKKGSPRLSILS